MAKKATTPETASVVPPVTPTPTPTPKAPKATKALKASKVPKVPKVAVAKSTVASTEPKKRNMTAVSTDFVAHVHKLLGEELAAKLKQKEVKEICEAFVKALVDDVKEGKAVSFTNNMSFRRKLRGARTYKNLKTGDPMQKDQHYVISMEVKPALKKVVETLSISADDKLPKTAKKVGGDVDGAEHEHEHEQAV